MDLKGDKPLTSSTDEQLVQLYRMGRSEAFESLVERYRNELYHFLVRFTGGRQSAEDVFQDAFLQVHQSIDTFQTNLRFKPWLFTIAANKARDHLRRSNRRPQTSLTVSAGASGEDRSILDLLQADLDLPEEQIEKKETQEMVQSVVMGLPDHLREILILAYFHQVPYKQIAQTLHIPLGTVKSRLHTAVGTFASHWKQKTEPK